jgi:hypothetical protein
MGARRFPQRLLLVEFSIEPYGGALVTAIIARLPRRA